MTEKYLQPKLNPEIGEKLYWILTDVINDYLHSIRIDKSEMINQEIINAIRLSTIQYLKNMMDYTISKNNNSAG